MIIETGINPNCSELVIRLGKISRKSALIKLGKIGIKEYFVKNFFKGEEVQTDWDDELNNNEIIDITNVSKNKLEELRKKDSDSVNSSIILLEEGKEADYENAASLRLCTCDSPNEQVIRYHQHCQPQGFPTLKKISDNLGIEVEPYDGGSIEIYDKWIEDGEPDPYNWSYE